MTVGHGYLFPALADENAGRANVIAQATAQAGQWPDMIQRWRGRQFNLYGKNDAASQNEQINLHAISHAPIIDFRLFPRMGECLDRFTDNKAFKQGAAHGASQHGLAIGLA